MLAALQLPELGAFYLAAAAGVARRRGAFPAGPAPAALAALTLRRALPAPAAGQPPSTAVTFADQAVFDLLSIVWRTGADLADDLPAVLDHLHALAEPLARSAAPTPPADGPQETASAPAPASADAGSTGDGPGGAGSWPVTWRIRTRRCARWTACSSTPPAGHPWTARCPATSSTCSPVSLPPAAATRRSPA